MNLKHCGLLLVALVALPAGRSVAQAPAGRYDLKLSEADGRLLVSEELAKGNNGLVRLSLLPQGRAFAIENRRITLAAVAQTDMLSCPVWISGVPAIVANKLTIAGADVRTDGALCNGTLTMLRPQALEALTAHPWDLVGRLAQASTRASMPGPRLPVKDCLLPEQLTLSDVGLKGDSLLIRVSVAARPAGATCS